MTSERAIIDIGSNTVRLVIYGPPARAPTIHHNEKITARLGKAVGERGLLSEKAMAQALGALARFAAILALRGVTDVQTVATAAVRDARNGGEFLARVAALGLSPRLLSGTEEALASARGVMAAFPAATGLVGDLGGGSLELVEIADGPEGRVASHGISLPLGTLLLPALRATSGPRFARRVRAMLRGAEANGVSGEGRDFTLVGGSWRAFGRYAMLRERWPVDDPHGFILSPEAALRHARSLREGRLGGRTGAIGEAQGGEATRSAKAAARALILHPLAQGMQVSAARMASLPDAAALLDVLLREIKPRAVIFSAWGLREGLLAGAGAGSMAGEGEDPLLAGVSAFVASIDADLPRRAEAVARWTAPIHAPTASTDAGVATERLRLAATMLALASMLTEPNLRPELAANWALRKRWIGVSDEGRAMLALAVLANSGRTAIPPDLLRLATPPRLREALAWGLATRLARRLTGGATNPEAVLAHSALQLDANGVRLDYAGPISALVGEPVLKDLRLIAECLGMRWAAARADGGPT